GHHRLYTVRGERPADRRVRPGGGRQYPPGRFRRGHRHCRREKIMAIDELIKEAEDKMKKSVEATRHEFTLIRTGRANPAMLEHVVVSYYGTELPLQQVASVSVPDPRQLMITPFDKNAIGAIEKGIQKSEVNLTPNNDGTCIRLNIPPLTEDRRKEFIKTLHKKAEVGHASMWNIRHDCNNHLK